MHAVNLFYIKCEVFLYHFFNYENPWVIKTVGDRTRYLKVTL